MEVPEIHISTKSNEKLLNLPEILQFRELFYIFSWRDIKVRYKQTFLGILWVVFQPLAGTFIFTVFFGNFAKMPSGDLPYALFVLCGLIFWNFFSGSLSHASDSLIASESIIKKVYFPKIILPLSSILTGFIDLAISLVLLFIFALVLGYIPQPVGIIFIPVAVIMTALTAAGLGLLFSSLNVKYRDIRYVLPFFIQIFLFITPIIYPLSIVSEKNKTILAINPMTSVVELVRMVFSPHIIFHPEIFIVSVISSVFLFIIGLWYFRRTEQFFADIV